MKKESVSSAVKNMMRALRAMVKSKTRALKARLIIYSLLARTNFLVSSVPLPTVTHHQHQHQHQHSQLQDRDEAETTVCTEYEANAEVVDRIGACAEYEAVDSDVDAETELTGVLGIGNSNGGTSTTTRTTSVIEMVKNFKEEAGEEFSLEKDIDDVADLFIRNFHRQMRMQKQDSLNRYQEMLFDGTL